MKAFCSRKFLLTLTVLGILSLGLSLAHAQFGWNPPQAPTTQSPNTPVVFDPNNFKIHKEDCIWAQRCRNCETMKRGQAKEKGGKSCPVCGG